MKKLVIAVIAALALIAAGCGGDDDDNAEGNQAGAGGELQTVRVAHLPSVVRAPMYIGIEKGFFEEEGIKVEPLVVQDGAAVTASVVSGDAEIGGTSWVPQLVAEPKGLPTKVIATSSAVRAPESVDEAFGESTLMVAADSDIKTAADLNGKSIATNALNGGIDLAVNGAAELRGADPSTFQYVAIPFPEMAAALDAGRVDAIGVLEPFTTAAVEAGHVKLFHNFPFDPEEQEVFHTSNYVTSERMLNENPEVIEAFLRGLRKANEYSRDNPDEVRATIPQFTRIEADVAAKIGLPEWPDPTPDPAQIQPIADLLVKYGFVEEQPDLDNLIADLNQ